MLLRVSFLRFVQVWPYTIWTLLSVQFSALDACRVFLKDAVQFIACCMFVSAEAFVVRCAVRLLAVCISQLASLSCLVDHALGFLTMR